MDIFTNEVAAIHHVESVLWPEGPMCPHCSSEKVYVLHGVLDKHRQPRHGLYKCAACRQQFTVRIGTIFEGAKVPLSKHLKLLYLTRDEGKPPKVLDIKEMLGVSYATAHKLQKMYREPLPTRYENL